MVPFLISITCVICDFVPGIMQITLGYNWSFLFGSIHCTLKAVKLSTDLFMCFGVRKPNLDPRAMYVPLLAHPIAQQRFSEREGPGIEVVGSPLNGDKYCKKYVAGIVDSCHTEGPE